MGRTYDTVKNRFKDMFHICSAYRNNWKHTYIKTSEWKYDSISKRLDDDESGQKTKARKDNSSKRKTWKEKKNLSWQISKPLRSFVLSKFWHLNCPVHSPKNTYCVMNCKSISYVNEGIKKISWELYKLVFHIKIPYK